jgi:hypothetical protein
MIQRRYKLLDMCGAASCDRHQVLHLRLVLPLALQGIALSAQGFQHDRSHAVAGEPGLFACQVVRIRIFDTETHVTVPVSVKVEIESICIE